jgi:SAM-dependent methyltransferase
MNEIVEQALRVVRKLIYHGDQHECPICHSSIGQLKPMGQRASARCPVCGSLERHRLLWLHCRTNTDLFDGRAKRLLHIAPEPCLARVLKQIPSIEYISSNFAGTRTTVRLDVTAIPFRDSSFDVILCNHVMEHVADDRSAMRELQRILKPGGWAIMQVPVKGATTLEDPAITSPEARALHYGQDDHVRQYGLDYEERLRSAGFAVDRNPLASRLSNAERRRYGLMENEDLYCCTKRP